MKQLASPDFWKCYRKLPKSIRLLADKNFKLLKKNAHHPSLHLKIIKKFCSVRIGISYRALAVTIPEGYLWFWIGSHSDYDQRIK